MVRTLIRRRDLRRLIWVCTVCLSPTKKEAAYMKDRHTFTKQLLSWIKKKASQPTEKSLVELRVKVPDNNV